MKTTAPGIFMSDREGYRGLLRIYVKFERALQRIHKIQIANLRCLHRVCVLFRLSHRESHMREPFVPAECPPN